MSVKEEVLKLLKENKDSYISGMQIAGKLNISRTAVWKAVKSLNDEGYRITGINKLGYKLDTGNDIISVDGINEFLREDVRSKVCIEAYKTITSTNTELKKRAADEKEWLILVAEEQTLGRGRMNRKFYSPKGTGIYISFLLRPEFPANEALMITTMCAVAVAETIDDLLDAKTQIKWVNDIFYRGKKVGIGINVKAPEGGFPDEIKEIAGALVDNDSTLYGDELRNRICARLIEKIYDYYNDFKNKSFMTVYKEKSMLIGQTVYIVSDDTKEPLKVLDVSDNAELIVEHKDGRIEKLSSGEVSVRPL